jgi:hypothetical protein
MRRLCHEHERCQWFKNKRTTNDFTSYATDKSERPDETAPSSCMKSHYITDKCQTKTISRCQASSHLSENPKSLPT